MKRIAILLLRVLVPVGILGFLIYRIQATRPDERPDALDYLFRQPKDWGRLALATFICLVAYCLSFLRWHMLVRSLDIPFRAIDALRLGFIGVLFSHVSLGSLGGDLFKAFFVAKEQPKQRTEIISTIFVDRAIGLYSLLLVTSFAFLIMEPSQWNDNLKLMARSVWVLTTVATICCLLFLILPWSLRRIALLVARFRFIRDTLMRLDDMMKLYRQRWPSLVATICVSLVIHLLLSMCIFVAATGLAPSYPSLRDHFVIWPIAGAAAALPIAPMGLGQFELALSEMYVQMTDFPGADVYGLAVALAYRLMVMAVAAVGVLVYWSNRKEVNAAIDAAERED